MYLVINKWVIAVKVSYFSGQYLRNHWTLDIGVLGYIGIVWPKEHSPEVWSVPPVTPCIYSHLKEEALDRTMWMSCFRGGFGPVVRQNTEWMNELPRNRRLSCIRHSVEPVYSLPCLREPAASHVSPLLTVKRLVAVIVAVMFRTVKELKYYIPK